MFCFFVCTGAGMSATKGSPAKSGWSGGGMLEIRKWHNYIWTIRKDLRSYMTSSPDIRTAVRRCPPLTDCWTRRAFVLHPRVPVCVTIYRWCWCWQLVIRAIFAPKAHQPHPDLRGQGQGPLSALASSDGGRPTRSWKRGHAVGSLRWESDFQSLSNTTKKQGGF